jgi:hypothetical protein
MSDEPQPMEIDPNDPGGVVETTPIPPVSPVSSGPIDDSSWESAIGQWINNHLRNSPLAGATEAWNHVMGALPHLRTYLETELKSKE